MRHALALVLVLSQSVAADEIRVTTTWDWNRWQRPGDPLSVENGTLRPGFIRRNIDAIANAAQFSGGIHGVGSNSFQADNLIDGYRSTYWARDPDAPIENWLIEINLGRAASAQPIERQFVEGSAPLEFFYILTSDDKPFFNNANSVIPRTLRYNRSTIYRFNTEHTVVIDFEKEPLQYIRIEADRTQSDSDIRLGEVSVQSIGDNISLGMRERGGSVSIVSEVGSTFGRQLVESVGISNTLVDGNITTYWVTVHRVGSGAQPEQQFLDLGALFWVDTVRMLGDGSGIAPGRGAGYNIGGTFNYLWCQFYASDRARSVDGSLRWEIMGEMPSDPRNLQGIVHFEEHFPQRKVRHVRLFFTTSNGIHAFNERIGTTAEWQVSGYGHPAEAVAVSPIFDLHFVQHITALHWNVETPPGSRIEIRSRTGNALQETFVFYDKNVKEVTQKRHNKLIPSFGEPIDTLRTPVANWSTWSRPYDALGQLFLSPALRRYVQLELRFISEEPLASASLNELRIEYNQPLAQTTRAEIFPRRVKPGQTSDFTHYLRADIAASSRGFDQIQIASSADLSFESLRIDGQTQTVKSTPIDQCIWLKLAEPVRRSTLSKIDFQSTLFLDQTRFDAFLFDNALGPQVRQSVDPAAADERIDSGVTFVALPSDDRLLDRLTLSSPALTPNGDGIHDEVIISFDLLKIIDPRPVELTIYDLAGRRIVTASDASVSAGRIALRWDGRTARGDLVSPGAYLLGNKARGDAFERVKHRIVTVVC